MPPHIWRAVRRREVSAQSSLPRYQAARAAAACTCSQGGLDLAARCLPSLFSLLLLRFLALGFSRHVREWRAVECLTVAGHAGIAGVSKQLHQPVGQLFLASRVIHV